LAFWPEQARGLLQYRADPLRVAAARQNAQQPACSMVDPLRDFCNTSALGPRPRLEGLRFPWQSAVAGVEQCASNDEDHIMGDIATAFRQYWIATHDVAWLKVSGWTVMEGIAQFYASRVQQSADGRYHIIGTCGPDEYHANVSDSTYSNAVAAAALRGAYQLASHAGAARNATFKEIADGLVIQYDAVKDYHPEFASFDPEYVDPSGKRISIKQADTVMSYYPLQLNASASTRENDLRIYAAVQDPHGVAMTWGIQAIVALDVGDKKLAAGFFTEGYEVFSRPPFYVWHEGNGTDGGASQGAPNLVTGAGGFLQSVWAGYGGVRFNREDGALTIRSPRPLPNSTMLKLRSVAYLGAKLDIVATEGKWSVTLNPLSDPSAHPKLELVMLDALEQRVEAPAALTTTPLVRKEGQEGYVRAKSEL
jgi:trehalose/maltose hydrolase-like predicted phosphorylase